MINGSSRNKVETIGGIKAWVARLMPQFGPDKRCEKEGTLKEVKMGRTALLFRWIIAKDAKLLKMLILN